MADGRSPRRGADLGTVTVGGTAWTLAELAYLRRLDGVDRALPAGLRSAAVACLVELLGSPSEAIALAAAQALARLDDAGRDAPRRDPDAEAAPRCCSR